MNSSGCEKTKGVAMTEQQRRYSKAKGNALELYKEFVVGQEGWWKFLVFELYNLFCVNTYSLLGYVLRRICLPKLLAGAGKGLVVGQGVVIRQPGSIRLGKGVIVEDGAVLDAGAWGQTFNCASSTL